MMTSDNGRIKKILFSILFMIILSSTLIGCSLSKTKKISSLVPFENIIEIKLVNLNTDLWEEKIIDKEQFEDIIKDVTYRKRNRLIKQADSMYYEIKYNDGTRVFLGDCRYDKYNAAGERVNGFQYIINGDLF